MRDIHDLFKAATGQSPYRYLLDQRLRFAKDHLRSGDLPIAEIAAQVGFPNHAHFSRAFRKREGISPTAWRERRSSSDFTPVRNDSIPDVVETIGAQTRGRTEQVVPRKLLYFLLN